MRKKKRVRKAGKRERLEFRNGSPEPVWARVPRSNLVHRRQSLGMSQRAVAEQTGVSQAYVSAVEKGIRILDLERIFQFAETLRTSPAAILTPGYFTGSTDIDDDLRHTQVR